MIASSDFTFIEQAFDRLRDASHDERAAILSELHERNPKAAIEIQRILAADGAWVDSAIRRIADTHDASEQVTKFGPYEILGVIGEGGFGIVHLAAQPAPMSRLVALKVIKPGMDSARVLRRFADERNALAMLDHPAIVTALDAGSGPDGRPFIVMPLVPGLPITEFCAQEKLSIGVVVGIMIDVCRGVHHAHTRGVIRRDIKPSNILVARNESGFQPKIIDFGLAKALDTSADSRGLTLEGQLLGTPEYVCPEQAAGDAVGTSGDIYALGAVMYELLTDRPPIERGSFAGLSPIQIASLISTARIVPPSHAGSHGIPRELDWIVLRCLEKEPSRRYQSAAAIAEDLENFRNGRRVMSGPPARTYRLWRMIRRHRFAVATVLVISAIATALTTNYAIQGIRQAADARAALSFTREMFEGLDPLVAQGRDRELLNMQLESARRNIHESQFSPAVRREILYTIGVALLRLGETAAARSTLQQAVDLYHSAGEGSTRSGLRAQAELMSAIVDLRSEAQQTYEQCESLYARITAAFGENSEEALAFLRPVAAADNHACTLITKEFVPVDGVLVLASHARTRIRLQRAIDIAGLKHPAVVKLALEYSRQLHGSTPWRKSGRQLLARVRASTLTDFGSEHPLYLAGLATHMLYENFEGNFEETVRSGERELETTIRVLGEQNIITLRVMDNLATALDRVGRGAEARTMQTRVVAITRETLGPNHDYSKWFRGQLARFMLLDGKPDEAVALYYDIDRDRAARCRDSAAYAWATFLAYATETVLDPHSATIHLRHQAERILRSRLPKGSDLPELSNEPAFPP